MAGNDQRFTSVKFTEDFRNFNKEEIRPILTANGKIPNGLKPNVLYFLRDRHGNGFKVQGSTLIGKCEPMYGEIDKEVVSFLMQGVGYSNYLPNPSKYFSSNPDSHL